MKTSIKTLTFLIWVAPVFFQFACSAGKRETPKEVTDLQRIYVEEVAAKESIAKTEVLAVTVKGNLPSPAYTFEHFDIKVRGNVIEITPLAKHETNKLVAQVLVPFEQVCRVGNLKPGKYEIKVKGRTRTIEPEQTVEVRE